MERPRPQPTILVIDDDPAQLASIAVALGPNAGNWRVEYVQQPAAAIELLHRRPVDVVLCDLHLPQVDGVALLEQVRNLQPHAVRIALCDNGGEAELLRAIPFAHQWLQKPIEPAVLYSALDRAITSGSFVHRDDLRAILGQAQALPSVPRLFAEVARLIADPEIDLKRITAVVERDPAMAAKVLQLANCSFYRPAQPLLSIREAVMRIGLRTLANCVLAAEMFFAMPREDRQTAILVDGIELRAQKQARLLTYWCETTPELALDRRELMPTAGLLHEIGALALLQFDPLSHRTALRLAQRHRLSLETLERRLIGASHARVAGTVLGSWGLPWPLVDVIANHHDTDRCHAPLDPCAMLAAAEVFVATPWLAEEFEAKAVRNGWGSLWQRWAEAAPAAFAGV